MGEGRSPVRHVDAIMAAVDRALGEPDDGQDSPENHAYVDVAPVIEERPDDAHPLSSGDCERCCLEDARLQPSGETVCDWCHLYLTWPTLPKPPDPRDTLASNWLRTRRDLRNALQPVIDAFRASWDHSYAAGLGLEFEPNDNPALPVLADEWYGPHAAAIDADLDDDEENCSWCDGTGWAECMEPVSCVDVACDGELCTCTACAGRGWGQVIW